MRARLRAFRVWWVLCCWLLCCWAVGCRPVVRADGGTGLLPVGAAAPALTGATVDGTPVALKALRGKQAVVYFYPKDETPGCTTEACAFRDAFEGYSQRGVTVFGVSGDSSESHRAFAENHKLPFPLVADEDGSLARAYGVRTTFGMASRVTFLIDEQGKVAHVWPDVDPGVHADQVLAVIDSTKAKN